MEELEIDSKLVSKCMNESFVGNDRQFDDNSLLRLELQQKQQ